jgi:cell division protein FtsQ
MRNQAAANKLPWDVRLMNFSFLVLVGLAVVGSLTVAGWWAVRHSVFSVQAVSVHGDTAHNNAVTLRANAMPKLHGNFFTLNLDEARQVFETVPWVRKAVVQREFPNRLRVVLQEHQPVAFWGALSESRLVNSYGEVFEANVDDAESENLLRLVGPEGQSQEVLQMVSALQPVLANMGLTLEQLELSQRGGWRVEADNGTVIELGSGNPEHVLARMKTLAATVPQVVKQYGRELQYADLRHNGGYAVRLKGIATGLNLQESTNSR